MNRGIVIAILIALGLWAWSRRGEVVSAPPGPAPRPAPAPIPAPAPPPGPTPWPAPVPGVRYHTLTIYAQFPGEPRMAAGSYVTVTPHKNAYGDGELVSLIANTPSNLWFNGWEVDGQFYEGGEYTNILMLSSHVIVANFTGGY